MASLKVHFLNVGHGDYTIIEHPSGRVTVIDINNAQSIDPDSARAIAESLDFSISKEKIYQTVKENTTLQLLSERGYTIALTEPIGYLLRLCPDKKIFRYIQTHSDLDHMRGLSSLKREFEIVNFWDTENTKATPDFRSPEDQKDWETYRRLRRSNTSPKVLRLNRGDSRPHFGPYTDDGDNIEILAPTAEIAKGANASDNHNSHSYVIGVSYQGYRVILPGDAESAVWDDLVETYGSAVKTTVLKAAHHGRKSGYHKEAVRLMRPEYTIVSVGKKPDTDASSSYRTACDNVWSTRWRGSIVLTIPENGQAYINSEYER